MSVRASSAKSDVNPPRASRSLRHKMAPATPTPVNTASPRSRCVIAIEGNIGIGKSTLLNALKRRFENDVSVVLVDEPVALWEEHGLLEAMYTDTINRCAFQVMAVTTRYTSLLDAVLRSEAEVIITERSIFSDRACFAKVNLTAGSPDETAYGVTHDALVNSLPEDLRLGTVLLQAPRAVITERIAKRGRAQEEAKDDGNGGSDGGIPDEYLAALDDAHAAYFASLPAATKALVDATQPPADVAAAVLSAIERIVRGGDAAPLAAEKHAHQLSPVTVLDAMQVA